MKTQKNYYKGTQITVGRGPYATKAVATHIEPALWRSAEEMQRNTIVRSLQTPIPGAMNEGLEKANKFKPGYEYAIVIVAREAKTTTTEPVYKTNIEKARAVLAAKRARKTGPTQSLAM